MKKIIVIGCPGSGKSTFSKALHKITDIPLFHLDMMYWNADQTTVEKSVFLKRLSETLQKNQWIIDGNYSSTMELRMQACDTVIFLDYPASLCLNGIQQRKGKARSDIPWTEPDKDDEEFVAFIKNYNLQSRPQVMQLLEKYSSKNIFVFTDRTEADDFLNQIQFTGFHLTELTDKNQILATYNIYKACMYMPTEEKFRKKIQQFLNDTSVKIFACFDGNTIKGMMAVSFAEENRAEILGIAVDAIYRRQGIGSFMLRWLADNYNLYAQTDDDAVGFYRKNGFCITKFSKTYDGETTVRYRCEFTNHSTVG